VLSYV
jgi:hypothetical protein